MTRAGAPLALCPGLLKPEQLRALAEAAVNDNDSGQGIAEIGGRAPDHGRRD